MRVVGGLTEGQFAEKPLPTIERISSIISDLAVVDGKVVFDKADAAPLDETDASPAAPGLAAALRG